MLSNVIEHLTGILSSSRDEGGAKAARQKLEETFSYPSITSLLPYREYDEKSDLFINSRSVGFIMGSSQKTEKIVR
jgi:conjugal transfer ATP-binding protein TraC